MKRKKLAVYMLTLLFILAAVVIEKKELAKRDFPFSVTVTVDGYEKKISCVDLGGAYYVFLPSYAEQGAATFCTNPVYDIYIGDQLLTDGMNCGLFPLDSALNLFYGKNDGEPDATVTFVGSGNVGTVYIDVRSGDMTYIHKKKGNEEGGHIQVYGADGRLWHQGDLQSIRGRGNVTWSWDKKPYSITLRNPANLLDMGEAEEWILLANAAEPTQLRNKIAYDLAAEVGLPYSPESRWVDLYLNGEYAGLYLLTERNEIHPQRVAANSKSFLVSMELEHRLQSQNYPYIRTGCGTVLRIHQSGVSNQSLRQIWESAENAIFAEDGVDPLTGKSWTELIDLDSWAQKYLLEELMGNYDAASVSQYFYYDDDTGKIFAGPVWDMDNSLGYDQWTSASNAILAGREHLWSDEDAPLFYALLEKEDFLKRVVELYGDIYRPALNKLCRTGLKTYMTHLSVAQKMNWTRWPELAWETDPETIISYIKSRMAFMDAYLPNKSDYITVHAWKPYYIWSCWAILPGETVEPLPEEEGYWYDMETGERFEFGTPIYENIILRQMSMEEAEEWFG